MSGFVAPALSFLSCRAGLCPRQHFIEKDYISMKFIASKHLWKLICLLAADVAVSSMTNARNVPSFMLIAAFALVLATLYYLIYNLLTFARLYGLSIKRKRHSAGVLTAVIGGLVALQSIGELNSRDVLLVLPLVIIGYGYSFYGRSGARSPDS